MKASINHTLNLLAALAVSVLTIGSARAQEARVQIIHNAADPAAETVDIYLGETLAVDDFAFRTATPFLDLTAGEEIVIGIAPGNSASSGDVIATFPVTLEADQTYTVIANGVLDPASFAANPSELETSFNLWIKTDAQETASGESGVDFFAVHGATDAPAVDIGARSVGNLVEGAVYGDITGYLSVPADSFVIDVKAAGTETVVASFDLNLIGLDGGSAAVLASGFLDPSANQDGPAFSLIAVLADGTVVELPVKGSDETARVQVIHNSADPAAAEVDVYLDDALAVDDFGFRAATPFLDLPAGQEIVIGIAPGTSTSVEDAIAQFPVTLEPGQTYTVVANGVLDPGSFDPNPDGLDTSFTLWIKEGSRELAADSTYVEFFAVHGATDAPGVDVWARGVTKLVEGAQYGGITDYVAVPPSAYTLDVQPAGSASIVASFDADLSGLAGAAAAVIASGFLNPPADYPDAAFAVLAVLPDGTVLELPASEADPTSRVQVIHNAADPAAAVVDVYLGEALAVDDFAFRSATPFLDLPAGFEATIGIAPGTSSSVDDVIAEFPVTLQAGEVYTVIANGVLNPGSFSSHSEGADISFDLWFKSMSRENAEDPSSVEFFVTHGSTDAPAVDVVARGVGPLLEGAAYGDITDYLAVPAGSYVIDILPAGSSTIVASFALDVSALEGGAAAILASGFLDPSANEEGAAFGLIAVLPDGTVVQPAVVTSTEGTTELPTSFSVLGNYPNPFNPSTNIRFDLPVAATVSVQVFDILGRNVLVTPPSNLAAGTNQSIQVDAQALPSGTYVYRVTATAGVEQMVDSGRMLLVK